MKRRATVWSSKHTTHSVGAVRRRGAGATGASTEPGRPLVRPGAAAASGAPPPLRAGAGADPNPGGAARSTQGHHLSYV
jgi:hypothetical protein